MRHDYEPCFHNIPDTWSGRWQLVREFTRRWHGVTLSEVGQHTSVVQSKESELGIKLPPSFREWVAFSTELIAQGSFGILRDCYEVTRLEEHRATSLLLQGEGDVYWAVKDENLGEPDPPIDMYFLDYESETSDRFVHCATEYPHLTSFVLGHMSYFLHGKGGGCLVRVNPSDEFLAEMHAAFPVQSKFDDLLIFEKLNLIVMLFPTGSKTDECHMLVELFRPIPMREIPDCIIAHTTNGGAFHGMLAPP